jgi:hypothetical protein
MERSTTQIEARELYGKYFIGIDELLKIKEKFPLEIPNEIPEIDIPNDVLLMNRKTHILILCLKNFNNANLNILTLREFFGISHKIEPNFYNQDWYLKEDFANSTLKVEWKLIQKAVIDDTRGVSPEVLRQSFSWPSAILCC